VVERIRARGPITVAEFMELALYHPEHGYYASKPQRSGRAGDFFTSVDVGPLFGELVAAQLDEMWAVLRAHGAAACDLVEAGAGNGRLTRDILDAARARYPSLYDALRVTLVERSARARARQEATLAQHLDRIAATTDAIPARIEGVLVANELLDAMPTHVVVMRAGTLREVHVAERDGELYEIERTLSDPRIGAQLARVGASLDDGWRAEVNLAATAWTRAAAGAVDGGFLLLFDYGHPAAELYSALHASGTLMSYRGHVADPHAWLENPGTRDLTTHVDLTAIEIAAREGGMTPLGAVDQTYFVAALGIADRLDDGADPASVRRRLAAKTLLVPGALGSTMKVMGFGKGVGRPRLRGLSSGRLT
jgi:SAM-dependent MidA family methyltransferase